MKLKIRQNGKYYQLGYYELGKWINLEQLGTAEKVLEMVRQKKREKFDTYQEPERTNRLLMENPQNP